MNNDSYKGIEHFKLVAALLVIMVHTSVISTYSNYGDFLLTRIIARIAVPFFFMVTGFFLISRFQYNNDRLIKFIKKISTIYLLSIIFYIPVLLYTDYFSMTNLLPNIIKDLLFDGVIYHLWYLPAAVIGSIIAWYLVKLYSFKNALIITTILFIIGLLGDNYYGIVTKTPFLDSIYNNLFQLFDYTRNGLFLAPIFIVLGGYIADKLHMLSLKSSIIGLIISLIAMIVEGTILYSLEQSNHDSMYLFLIPTMYFLFNSLTYFKGARNFNISTIALLLYIIHPMVIIVLRMFAKMSNTTEILINNSLIHFGTVSMISLLAALVINHFINKYLMVKSKVYNDRAWVEINSDNLKHNINTLKQHMVSGCELMGIVKANAYGHGTFKVATVLSKLGINIFGVATIDEAIALRKYGIKDEILILGYTSAKRANDLYRYKLIQTIVNYDHALSFEQQRYKIKAHIKVDTGMHRLGFDWNAIDEIVETYNMINVKVHGIFSHLCVADSLVKENESFTVEQISRFDNLLAELKQRNITIPKTHIQSSYGFLNYPNLNHSYIRIGISMFGAVTTKGDHTRLDLNLKPVLTLKAKVTLIREIPSNESIGYGRTFNTTRDSLIAIVSIGYADGLPRILSSKNNVVLINKQYAPIIGRICMDQLTIDITDIDNVEVGSIVTIIGKDGDNEIAVSDVASNADSITNELLSRIGSRISN